MNKLSRIITTLSLTATMIVATQVSSAPANAASCISVRADTNAGGDVNRYDGWYSFSGWFRTQSPSCNYIYISNIAMNGNGYECAYSVRVRVGKAIQETSGWFYRVCSRGVWIPLAHGSDFGGSLYGKLFRIETRGHSWFALRAHS